MPAPHGGSLFSLLVAAEFVPEVMREATELPWWSLTPRQLCDFELLANGGFSPLTGFLSRRDYEGVLTSLRLTTGLLWPIPVTLGVPRDVAAAAERAGALALCDTDRTILGVLRVEDAFEPDRAVECEAVFGTVDSAHAGVAALLEEPGERYLGGRVEALELPPHFDFRPHRHTPAELRAEFARRGWERVVAFQTRNPMHRAHYELTMRAVGGPTPRLPSSSTVRIAGNEPLPSPLIGGGEEKRERSGPRLANSRLRRGETSAPGLLIHPSVGLTKSGDIDHYTRVRCYQAILPRYSEGSAMLSLLPLAMRLAGPREALWHAIIRQNYGCTHFIVGRDHAGPGADSSGKPFYGAYEAQKLVSRYQRELGIGIVPFGDLAYLEEQDAYVAEDEMPKGSRALKLSGTELRRRLVEQKEIPDWFTFPEVVAELRRAHAPRRERGLTVFLTGLPGAGKSTIARALEARLLESGRQRVTVLDGDQVRKQRWPELGFSKEDRDENIRRIGNLAAELTKGGGIAICAAIAPYDAVRQEVRRTVGAVGDFVLVHVATPSEVCEARDRKGFYARARAGTLKGFTGVSDPYEVPGDAEVVIDGASVTPAEAVGRVLALTPEP